MPTRIYRTRKALTGGVIMRRCSLADMQPLLDFIDTYLRNDWHLPPAQFRDILSRPKSDVWAILRGKEIAGFAIVYEGSRLHNLFLSPAYRGLGLGSRVLRALSPKIIRAKRNMSTGDPVPFYEKRGYRVTDHAPGKLHIALMEKRRKSN